MPIIIIIITLVLLWTINNRVVVLVDTMTVAVYKSFCLKGRFISHLVCLGYPGLEGVDPSRNGIKKKANNKEHSQQFFEKALQIMENLEHSVVLLLFLFTLDHSSFSANLYPSLKVTKTQL